MCGPDGCGGQCSTCPIGYSCQDGTCIQEGCQPNCNSKKCGPNGCGGSCGDCAIGEFCVSGGACLCMPNCAGKMCGPDGCGGQCGGCPWGYGCVNNVCTDGSCEPQCDGKECGPDGCGGDCGPCADQGYCDEGYCYDCTEEGFCNAVACPSDDNPCTLEKLSDSGQCMSILNTACDEPIENLQRIYRGAQAYYTNWQRDPEQDYAYVPLPIPTGETTPLLMGPNPVEGTCCQALGGPDTNGNNACDHKWSWSFFDSEWEYLDFDAGQEFRYVYTFEEIGDGATASPVLFEARAAGDLDCDGEQATFVIRGKFGNGEGFYKAENYLNVLARPKWITYVSEDNIEEVLPSTWPDPLVTHHSTSEVYDLPFSDFYPIRFSEAIQNLLRIYRGAKRFYEIPKAELDSPGCQLRADAKAILEGYEGVVPYSQQPFMQGLTPVEATCCGGYGGPDHNDDGACDPHPDIFRTQTWIDLGFMILGQFQYIYKFEQAEENDGVFSFSAAAIADLDCDGEYASFSLDATAEPDGAQGCAILRDGVVAYKTRWWEDRAIGIPISTSPDSPYDPFATIYGELQLEEIPTAESFEFLFAEQLDRLDLLVGLIAQHWEQNCTFPESPPRTPNVVGCCNDNSEDCPVDVEAWSHPFWQGIGFSIDEPHPYIYEFESKPAGGAAQVIFIRVLRDNDCNQWHSNSLERVGIAEAYEDGTCAFLQVDGINPLRLFD